MIMEPVVTQESVKKSAVKIAAKSIVVKVLLPSRIGGSVSNQYPKDILLEVFRKSDPRHANLTDVSLENAFDQLGVRERKRLLYNYSEKMAQIKGINAFIPRKSKDELLLIQETLPRVPYYHNDRPTLESSKVIKISAESVESYINPDLVPERVHKNDWKHWSLSQRLRYHLDLIADGNKFEWDYVEL
jgi:hypothetical protein